MAKTKVSDVIVPAVFAPYSLERTATLAAVLSSGIVGMDPEFDRLASAWAHCAIKNIGREGGESLSAEPGEWHSARRISSAFKMRNLLRPGTARALWRIDLKKS